MTSINTRRSAVTLIHCCHNHCYLPVVVFVIVAVAAAAPRSDHEALARPTFDHSVRHPTAGDHVQERLQPVDVHRTQQDPRNRHSSSPAEYVNSNATTEKPVSTTVPADSSMMLNSSTMPADSTTVPADSTTVPTDSSTVLADLSLMLNSSTTPDSSTMPADSTTVIDSTTVPADSSTVLADSSTVPDPFTILASTAVPTTTESNILQIPSPPGQHDAPTTISTTPMPSASSAASCRTVFLIPFVTVIAASLLMT